MRILLVSRYKTNYADHQLPFVTEQGEALRRAGCEVGSFLVRGNYLTAVKPLKQKIVEFRPDIVHAHYGLSAITAELQQLCPVVTTFHNGEWHNVVVNLASSLLSLRAKHVIYVASHIRQKVWFKHKNFTILPCGISLEDCQITPYEEARKRLGWDPTKRYILFGGAFANTRKNVQLLREALASPLLHEDAQVELIEMSGLSRAECVLRMCAADLFALPTKNEGSPQALKEAMACRCPIVATDVADIQHLLGSLPGHFLLSNRNRSKAEWRGDENSATELAQLVQEALSLPAGFRTQGRERIIDLGYTNDRVAQRLMEIYHEVLQNEA